MGPSKDSGKWCTLGESVVARDDHNLQANGVLTADNWWASIWVNHGWCANKLPDKHKPTWPDLPRKGLAKNCPNGGGGGLDDATSTPGISALPDDG